MFAEPIALGLFFMVGSYAILLDIGNELNKSCEDEVESSSFGCHLKALKPLSSPPHRHTATPLQLQNPSVLRPAAHLEGRPREDGGCLAPVLEGR